MPYINVDEVYILDNTGAQVDQVTDLPYADAGLTESQQAQARKNISAGGTNPNLLDNPFFTVNQRGAASYTGNVYMVDRWKGANSRTTITVNAGYVNLSTNSSGNGFLQQKLSESYTGVLTYSVYVRGTGAGVLSIQDSNGTSLDDITIDNPGNDWTLVSGTYEATTPVAAVVFRVNTSTNYDIKCVKLEVGSVSTLANDVPPDYGTELAKCRYYFHRLNASGAVNILTGATTSTTSATFVLPHEMAVNTGSITRTGTITVNGQSVTAASQTQTSAGVTITVTASGLIAYNGAVLNLASGAYIDISHDL